jgi:Ca-activated chloride channel family protein
MLGNEKALWLLFLVPLVLVPVYILCFYRKSQSLTLFAQPQLLGKLNHRASLTKQIFKAFIVILAFVFIVIALTEPAWNPKPVELKRQGRDVAILLDVSRSMLADDIKPSRLERAKLAIRDLIEVLGGDRIALMTFAGSATIKCPLTNDYSFLSMVLDRDVTTESTPVGGTNLGDAIRKATREIFDISGKNYMDMIIISDGEENENTFPDQAAAEAGQQGIRIIAIGLGSQDPGARIPIDENGRKTFLKYNGQEVWTKLTTETLAKVASASKNGKFLTVGPNQTFDLDELYKDLVASAQKREIESAASMQYDQKFQIFIALAIILLITEVLISERKKV